MLVYFYKYGHFNKPQGEKGKGTFVSPPLERNTNNKRSNER